MKTQRWVYIAIALLSVGAGVAIAGVPSVESRSPTIPPPPASTEVTATETTITETNASSVSSESSAANVDAQDDERGGENGEESAVEVTTTNQTTTSTTTTTTSTTTTTTVPLTERAELDVAVVNGAEVGGAATAGSDSLEESGYNNVGSFDGSEIVDVTVVFAADGLQGEAERLAVDIGVGAGLVFPLATAPEISGLGDDMELVVYLGSDVVDLEFFN